MTVIIKCQVDNCPNHVRAKMYCAKHYRVLLRYGDAMHINPKCKAPNCKRGSSNDGFCYLHDKGKKLGSWL